jgi:Flp pilus assembly protein TadD
VSSSYKYCAFISYSHKDEKWASWLHKALETYKVPKHLVGQKTAKGKVPERLGKVFRDREELPSSPSLGTELTQALEDSAVQIVICSPNAARSHWTNEEILTYKRLGRETRILCLIVDGEPGASAIPDRAEEECFPPALRFKVGDDGELTTIPSEPIAADARPHGDGKPNAKLKLISGMLGVGFDALKQREQQRRHRRMLMVTSAAVAGMVITSGLAAYAMMARNEAERQRLRAEVEAETARRTTEFMVDLFEVSDPSEALGNTITAREILDKGAERIESQLTNQPTIQATLMDTMGTVYTSLGLYDEAVALLRKSLDTREALHGPEDPEVAASMDHLGEVLGKRGDFGEAERLFRQALETKRGAGLGKSLQAAKSLSGVAEMLMEQGKYADAEPLYKRSLRCGASCMERPIRIWRWRSTTWHGRFTSLATSGKRRP